MKHIGTRTINTERLILRRFVETDAQEMFKNYASRDKVTEFLPWQTHKSVKDTEDYLTDVVLPAYVEENTYRWAIVWKDTNQVIGCIDVIETWERLKRVELGWVLSDDFWGLGIMPEAGKEVLKYLFEVGYERIQAKHDSRNHKSGRVMQKIGMLHEGTLRKYYPDRDNEDKLNDCEMWAITK